MNFPLFIARRIYNNQDAKHKVSRPAILIAILGVAIGLAVMIVSVCVILGFKHTIRDKVIGFGSHITVGEYSTVYGGDQHPIVINDSLLNVFSGIQGVEHVQRYTMAQGILKTDSDFMGVMFKGIGEDYDTTFIHKCLLEGVLPQFRSKESKQQILVSKTMADKLNLHAGDRIFAYFLGDNDIRTRRFTITGIYQSNLKKFDEALCFTDFHTAQKLNGYESDMATGAEIMVKDFSKLELVDNEFIDKVNRKQDRQGNTYASITIKENYSQIFSWLDLLDLNVWIILVLMISVAGFTMISGLLIIILERANMIGVLKALGARNKTIRHTFLWFAVFIIGQGMLWGNILGIGIVLLQKFTGIVKLDPATYYVATAPVELNIPLIILINVCTLIISVFVLIAPSYLISRIHPAKSMRYE
ncbi:MAG: ABC transporter permease [Prevotella sp.]|nr:ABC transporter permease [Prevotella sp.]